MSKIYSQLSLKAIEFHSKICEQTRSLRQLTLTSVHKVFDQYRSVFVQEEMVNVMKMYKCARKVSQLWYQMKTPVMIKNTNIIPKCSSIRTPINTKNLRMG